MTVVKDKEREYVYFMYSETQELTRTEVESGLNKTFIPGKVLVYGQWKPFTCITKDPNSFSMFPDIKIVAEGYRDNMKYKDCTSEWRMGNI